MKHSLSVMLIVKNEQRHLREILKTVKLFADEIIVIDTGSTDGSKRIARQYATKVYDLVWKNDFAQARNFGIRKCTKEYIMWLDADDRINPAHVSHISTLLSEEPVSDIYFFPYHYLYHDDGEASLVASRARIFRKKKNIHFEYPVHECLIFSATATTTAVDIPIYHGNKNTVTDSAKRNMGILVPALKKKKYRDDMRLWWCLGREYIAMDEKKNAVAAYKTALGKNDKNVSPNQRSQIEYELGRIFLDQGEQGLAYEQFKNAEKTFPHWREPIFEQAKILLHQEKYKEALGMFLKCQRIAMPASFDVLDRALYKKKTLNVWLGRTYVCLGNYYKALYYSTRILF